MMKSKPSKMKRTLNHIVDSDDEYPSDSDNESIFTPAYLDNNRFNREKENDQFYVLTKVQPLTEALCSELDAESIYENMKNMKPKQIMVLRSAVLSKKDLFCLKSIEHLIDDRVFLWFVRFLIYKDLQADYSFWESSLVPDLGTDFKICVQKTHTSVDKYLSFEITEKS